MKQKPSERIKQLAKMWDEGQLERLEATVEAIIKYLDEKEQSQ